MKWYEPYIERVPGVVGGAPVLRGTRTPVATVVVLHYDIYARDLGEVRAALPHLTQEQIDAAIAYYQDHTKEIDTEIYQDERALAEFRGIA